MHHRLCWGEWRNILCSILCRNSSKWEWGKSSNIILFNALLEDCHLQNIQSFHMVTWTCWHIDHLSWKLFQIVLCRIHHMSMTCPTFWQLEMEFHTLFINCHFFNGTCAYAFTKIKWIKSFYAAIPELYTTFLPEINILTNLSSVVCNHNHLRNNASSDNNPQECFHWSPVCKTSSAICLYSWDNSSTWFHLFFHFIFWVSASNYILNDAFRRDLLLMGSSALFEWL